MKDIFGIQAAIAGAIGIYFRSARQTGRTKAMVNLLNNGDRIICSSQQCKNNIEQAAAKVGKSFVIVVCKPDNSIFHHSQGKIPRLSGKTVFDHVWLEQHVEKQILKTFEYLDDVTEDLSFKPEDQYESLRLAHKTENHWRI